MSVFKGNNLKFEIFGASHSEKIGINVCGLPANEPIDLDELASFMARRAPGQSELTTARRESDEVQVTSGLADGILTGAVWFDTVFGSLTTLLAAYFVRKLRNRRLPVPLLVPVALNAVVVGSIVCFAYAGNPSPRALPLTVLTVGIGEAVACIGLGIPLLSLLSRAPAALWED